MKRKVVYLESGLILTTSLAREAPSQSPLTGSYSQSSKAWKEYN